MAAHGKSINVFLMDGTASGRVKCTLANWTGVAYRIPRVDLDLCKERDDLKESELEEFIDYAKILMGVLGHKVFEPLVSEKPARGGPWRSGPPRAAAPTDRKWGVQRTGHRWLPRRPARQGRKAPPPFGGEINCTPSQGQL